LVDEGKIKHRTLQYHEKECKWLTWSTNSWFPVIDFQLSFSYSLIFHLKSLQIIRPRWDKEGLKILSRGWQMGSSYIWMRAKFMKSFLKPWLFETHKANQWLIVHWKCIFFTCYRKLFVTEKGWLYFVEHFILIYIVWGL